MSHLLVNGLRVRGKVGCKDAERAHPQMLRFDLRIDYDMRAAVERDDVSQAIDYKAVAGCIRELVGSREWKLLETLAHDVAARMRTLHETTSRVEVSVTKDVIVDSSSVAVVYVLE
jgi:7,8-dihydroneopterin aldolase/epimerase/oxygenase